MFGACRIVGGNRRATGVEIAFVRGGQGPAPAARAAAATFMRCRVSRAGAEGSGNIDPPNTSPLDLTGQSGRANGLDTMV